MTSTPLPISVFIIAKNEADRITKPIQSVVGWVDDVHVIDSGSTDDTVAVSEALGAEVTFRKWEGYGPQKVFGESLCKHPWVLNLDADEEITPALKEEIIALFAAGEPQFKAYDMPRRELHFAEMSHRFSHVDHWLRLYHRDYAGFKDSTVHDSVEMKRDDAGEVGRLKGEMLHRCFRSYRHMVEKVNFYSDLQAEDMFKKGRRPSTFRIVVEPFYSFLKAYLLRRYFLRGVSGFIESVHYAYSRLLRLAKARALFVAADKGGGA